MMESESNHTPNINQLLHEASLQGDVTLLQELIQRDPLLIYRSSTTTSPLHVACKLGHVQFAWELLSINPSLADELDPIDKLSPLHVASRNGHVELVRSLVSVSPSMCFVRDVHGMNPVHVAVVKGHLNVLDEFLRTVPVAAKEGVGFGGAESIMHLCVKHNRLDALKMVVTAVGDAEMLNATNGDGNNILHVAVANKQLEIVHFLLNDRRIKRNTPNSKGLTTMDIFTQSHNDPNNDYQLKQTLKRFKALPSEDIRKEKEKDKLFNLLENQRSALMVVASLIATMAFQAAVSPPGGSWQDDENGHIAGTPIMAKRNNLMYNIFVSLSTIGLVSSMTSILLLISGLPCRRCFVTVIMVTMWAAITAMTSAYGVSLYALKPNEDVNVAKNIILSILAVWVFVMGLLFLGHVTLWTIRFLRCCLPRRRTI